jgi:phosphohistidine swiveling domain-containing protein
MSFSSVSYLHNLNYQNTGGKMYCVNLSHPSDLSQIGGKAANLSRAIAMGEQVPPGFVMTCDALTFFLAENTLMSGIHIWLTDDTPISRQERIRSYANLCQAIMAAPIPEALRATVDPLAEALLQSAQAGLAVRSSGIQEDTEKASFAGIYDSVLGVTSIETLWTAIRQCWCSAWSPGAIDYARKLEINLIPASMAIIVQEMVPAKCAGVIFSVDPLTGNPWRFVLNATFGLARDLVAAGTAADQYVLSWDTGEILEQKLAEKETMLLVDENGVKTVDLPHDKRHISSLPDRMIQQLWQLALRLDHAFDRRVDIEWAVAGEKIYLVQVRQVTALPAFFPHELSGPDAEITWTLLDRPWDVSAEVVAGPIAPLFRDRQTLELWERHLPPGGIFMRRTWQERDFNGYRYTTEWIWVPDGYDDEGKIAWLKQHEVEIRNLWLAQAEAAALASERAAEVQRTARRAVDLIPTLLALCELETDTLAATWAAPQWMIFICEHLLKEFLKAIAPDFAIGNLLQGLPCFSHRRTKAAQDLGRSIHEERVKQAFREQSLEAVISYLRTHDPGCQFLDDYEQFCFQVGIRPPTWPGSTRNHNQILFTIKSSMLGEGQYIQDVQKACVVKRQASEVELRRLVVQYGPDYLEKFDMLLTWAQFWTPALDDRHGVVAPLQIRLLDLMRQTGELLVREGLLDAPTDLFLLTPDDLAQIATATDVRRYRPLYLTRQREYEHNRRLVPPLFLGRPPKPSSEVEATPAESTVDQRPRTSSTKIFQGDGLAPGQVTGIARKAMDLSDAASLDSLTSEHILVYPGFRTWPDWLSLLMVVKGLVTVQGVQLHHATQLARECGVPYINLTREDWDSIPDNRRIALNGNTGVVTLL